MKIRFFILFFLIALTYLLCVDRSVDRDIALYLLYASTGTTDLFTGNSIGSTSHLPIKVLY